MKTIKRDKGIKGKPTQDINTCNENDIIELLPGDIITFHIPVSINKKTTLKKSLLEIVLQEFLKRYFQEIRRIQDE